VAEIISVITAIPLDIILSISKAANKASGID